MFCIRESGFVESLEKLDFQKFNTSGLICSVLLKPQYLRCENGDYVVGGDLGSAAGGGRIIPSRKPRNEASSPKPQVAKFSEIKLNNYKSFI